MNLRDYPVTVDELVDTVAVTTTPAHAPTVTMFVVGPRQRGPRWVVARNQDGTAVVSEHSRREVAVRSAICRARRYARAYCVPRSLAVTR